MLTLIVENVRTFSGRHEIAIRPLTILTGENSSGKTTFLASLSSVCDSLTFPFAPVFNRVPFNLGNFDTIATYKGGRFGRAKTFTLGFTDDAPGPSTASHVEATYRNRAGQPEIAAVLVKGQRVTVRITMEEPAASPLVGTIAISWDSGKYTTRFVLPRSVSVRSHLSLIEILFQQAPPADGDKNVYAKFMAAINSIPDLYMTLAPGAATSIAPIRTRPERTYSQQTSSYDPGGEHVPFVLDRLYAERTSPEARSLISALRRFGDHSGLFTSLGIRRFAAKAGEPFQLLITLGGRPANLIDVGYGISQVLPVLVETVLARERRHLLLQQPEIHLHPRGQAALGTFFAEVAAHRQGVLVVETHSDFIIDRIRQEVAKGTIAPENVALLFFDRQGLETTVSTIALDGVGNLVGAPPTYRQFFMHEELKLLNRAE